MDIAQEIYDFIVGEFKIEVDDEFDADVHLFDYGYVDSLDATKIVVHLETNYGIEITQRDLILYPMNTINELAKVVKSKIEA